MASYRIASSQEHQLSKEEQASLGSLKKRFGPSSKGHDYTAELKRLAAAYSAKGKQLFPADTASEIRNAVKRATAEQPNGPEQRYLSLVEADRRDIDLGKLKAAQDRHFRDVEELVGGGKSFASSDVAARTLAAPFDWRPTLLPPDLGGTTTYVPPFGESWERWIVNQIDGATRVSENRTYLEAEFGVSGANLEVENHDAGDWNHFDVGRGNGFFVPFTMPSTGVLQISAELICLLCRHHVSTSDEWGWSDFWCKTATAFAVSVFWNHDDGVVASEDLKIILAPGLDARGDGESYPGTVTQVAAGDQRSANFYTDVAFPAGKTVWIYAGISNRIFAMLNDVSIEASIDSSWQISSLSVTTL